MIRVTRLAGPLLGLVAIAALAAPASAQLQWSSKDEKTTFKIGFLGQGMAESADVAGTTDTAQNLFLRRLRLLMSFTLGDKLSLFVDTDDPNLGKSSNTGVKDAGTMYVQDFAATYKFAKEFQLDAGILLLEQTYNHNQSAATLLPTDYGSYTFVESTPLQERVGRDYGVRARGYLADDHLEYRLGVYDGLRGNNAANNLRVAGRVMYSFFTPQVGLFYRGTSLGKTRTLAIGGSFDTQEKYHSYGADVFFDQPLADGNGLVLQADYSQVDGSTFVALPEQNTLLLEAGFFIGAAKLQPFVQYAAEDFKDPARVDESRVTGGLGYYVAGHNNNVKISYTEIEPKHGKKRGQFNLQWQIFQF